MARDGALTDAKARVLITTLFGNFFIKGGGLSWPSFLWKKEPSP
jgi:hypothetical protein